MVVRERGVWVSVVLAACGLFLLAGPALAGEGCRGKLSGAASGEFACSLDASYRAKKDVTTLVISVPAPPPGVKSLAPCSFDLKGKPEVGTLTLKDLGRGGSILNATDGKDYFASGALKKGSLTLEIQKVEPLGKLGFKVTGKLTATLQEVAGPGQVTVEASF
ncbi:MAG TPA: hypothetical protein PK668_10095 [Myxococcota bacterium]|nr:hypothetical protein [Myxococcota bacterium]HRY93483.1 hypothetical protein [Myxococcota bacterium]HSA23403.1 hypothetical protein [Myxococcota bacterium]